MIRILLELVSKSETDIIAALEGKYNKNKLLLSFNEDPRVYAALQLLTSKEYHLEPTLVNLYDQMTFLDNAWMTLYLMRQTGDVLVAEQISNNLLSCYNPFNSNNHVVVGFAYCDAIDKVDTSSELEGIVQAIDQHIGESDEFIFSRMYSFLMNYADDKSSYFIRIEKYAKEMISRICALVVAGDKSAKCQEYSEAAEKYGEAAEIAEYQLRRPELAYSITKRIGQFSQKEFDGGDLVEKEENKERKGE